MLNIDLPIIGAPMFLISYPDLVAAVSNAGGIGCFPALNYRTIEELKEGLSEIREKTNKPIGVNLILLKQMNPLWNEQLKACLDAKVELIITSLGAPRSIVNEVKSINAKIFCDVTTLKHARIIKKAGADAVIAVSQGAGGHAGAISPFSFIPYLKEEIDLPVIAAGSIGTGEQMAAALALGAESVYLGTRFIASKESPAQQDYKEMLISEQPEDIVYSNKISGINANWLKKSLDRHADLPETQSKKWKHLYSAGHGIAQIKEILPVQNIIDNILNSYVQSIKNHLPLPS